jgi:hypothetical protein
MDKARESFIIYTSFYRPISRLSDKQLGKLFRAIFQYNLGEELSIEEDIEMAFGFFVNQFEIDEAKWQSKVVGNRENGRRGGNPNFKRGQKNPYYSADEKITKDNSEITQDNSEITQDNLDNPRLCKITEDNRGLSKITEHNPINDNDNDNVLKKSTDVDTKSPPSSPPSDSYVFRDLSEIMIELRGESGWIEQFAKKYDCTADEILSYLDEYVKQQIEDNKTLRSKDDVRRHIRYWLPKFINSTKNERTSPTDRFDKRRGTPATSSKPKNYTTTF